MTTRTIFLTALVWAVVVVLVVHFLDFPGSVPNFRQVSGGGTLLDASPAFTADSVYQRLGEYGDEGRRNYSFRNVTVDILGCDEDGTSAQAHADDGGAAG